MFADNERYEELIRQKEEQNSRYNERITELHLKQKQQTKENRLKYQREKDERDQQILKLQQRKDQLLSQNAAERRQIEDEAWAEIEYKKDEHKNELIKIIEAGVDSKAELTRVKSQHNKAFDTRKQLKSDINDKQQKLNEMIATYNELRANKETQKLDLADRENTIRDKNKRIHELKK